MFYNRGEVISDQFGSLDIDWKAPIPVSQGGVPMFPHSPVINITQNVNIFVKTKNDQGALKHKINLKFFLWHGRSHTGGVGGGLTTWEKFPRNVVFDSEDLPKRPILPFGAYQKWRFGCPNQNSETTFEKNQRSQWCYLHLWCRFYISNRATLSPFLVNLDLRTQQLLSE